MSWILRQHLELSFKKSQMYTGQNQVERMMKKYWFCLFYLLLMVVPLLGIPFEQTEEYNQKQAILNERAARFKAETGFEGDIAYNYQYMTFSIIFGNFRDIVITAPQDTVYMSQVFDRVFDKVKPYISAQEGQLFKGKTSSNTYITRVRYQQIVNGYPVFGAGSLKISYNYQVKQLSINNSTVCIPDDYIMPILTNEDAIKIYANAVPEDELLNLFSNRSPKFELGYCNINEYKLDIDPEYRLCWVGGSERKLVIDAVSGEIYVNEMAVVLDLPVNVNGTAY